MKTFYYYAAPQDKMIALIVFKAPSKDIADTVIETKFSKEDKVKFAAEK